MRKTEIAFAKSMSDRDLAAFATFLTEDSIFMSGGNASLGIKEIEAAWKPLFEGAQAPFFLGTSVCGSAGVRHTDAVFPTCP